MCGRPTAIWLLNFFFKTKKLQKQISLDMRRVAMNVSGVILATSSLAYRNILGDRYSLLTLLSS